LLDGEYERLIDTAKLELERVGISSTAIATADKLIINAIVTFVKAETATSQADRIGFYDSFKYQIDNMRKCESYV